MSTSVVPLRVVTVEVSSGAVIKRGVPIEPGVVKKTN